MSDMSHVKFDLAKMERLNDPGRFQQLDPEKMWEALGRPNPRAIVEIGAGTGLFAVRFAALAPHATVYAADTEPAMLDWMRTHRHEVDAGRIIPVPSGESSIPLADAMAGVVYMINVHHEMAEPDDLYAEAFRLTEPAGQILVVDWKAEETPKGPPLLVRASAATLSGFLARAGFTDIRVHDVLPWHTMLTGVRPADGE